MNESHSPQVTGRSARANGVRNTGWPGYSLSKPNPAAVADLDRPPSCSIQPALGGACRPAPVSAGEIGGVQGVAREDVLDVHEQELLVLLLMVEPEGDQLGDAGDSRSRQQSVHGLVHELAVAGDLVDARTGEETALGPRMPIPDRLVVRVEDVGVGIVVRVVAGGVLPEDERLEEPGHVGPMPLGRAHVGHRLHRLVLGAQDGGPAARWWHGPGVVARQLGRRFSTAHIHEIRPFAAPPGAVAHTGSVPINPTQGCSPSGANVLTFTQTPGGAVGNPQDRAAEGTPDR